MKKAAEALLGFPGRVELVQQQESIGRRKASRLAERETLCRPRILVADVVRNRTTKFKWDETVERVRNSENGWCWGGKPAQ